MNFHKFDDEQYEKQKGAFNGLRVGMALHSATSGLDRNKYDGGREELEIKSNLFDFFPIYQGSAVRLVQGICVMSYGGEILATKAMYEALMRSKQGGDDITVQEMGTFYIENVRSVELMQLEPTMMPHRNFPPHKQRHKSTFDLTESPSLSHYDPFPSTNPERKDENENNQNGINRIIQRNRHRDGDRDGSDREDFDDDDRDDGYGTTKEIQFDDDDDNHSVNSQHSQHSRGSHGSHSSDNDEHQHHPRISQPRRRPSITQFTTGPNSKIEVSFTGGDDDDGMNYDLEPIDDHKSYSTGNASHSSHTGFLEVGRDPYGANGDSDYSIASIEPPRQNVRRNKAKEIERRKSGINRSDLPRDIAAGMYQDDDLRNDGNHSVHSKASSLKSVKSAKSAQSRSSRGSKSNKMKSRKSKKRKRKMHRQRSESDHRHDHSDGRDGRDGRDGGNIGKIVEPNRKPRRNKKQQHFETMVGINFNPNAPHNDDSSVYSAGSRGSQSMRSKSAKILNPAQQLKLYKTRPNDLPVDYSEDLEYTCLSCQCNKKWTDGVWRVPMWPSFDVCMECAEKVCRE